MNTYQESMNKKNKELAVLESLELALSRQMIAGECSKIVAEMCENQRKVLSDAIEAFGKISDSTNEGVLLQSESEFY